MANSKIKQILVGSTTYDIEDASAAHLSADNIFTGTNSFRGPSKFSHLAEIGDFYIHGGPTPSGNTKLRISYELGTTTMPYSDYGCLGITLHHPAASEPCELIFPRKSGIFALTGDIDVKAAGNNTFTGTNTFAYNSIKINNKYHADGASWATTIQGWDPTGGGNNDFILTLPKTSGTITVGVKANGTIHAADSSGLVDLGTISGGSSGVTSVTTSGSGNAVTSASISGNTLTLTKGSTFLTAHQSLASCAKLSGGNTFSGVQKFNNKVNIISNDGLYVSGPTQVNTLSITMGKILYPASETNVHEYKLPDTGGTLALTSDIDVTAAGNNTFTGTNTFETEFQSSLYRTIIDKNGVSVGSGPSSGILVSTTYDYNRIKYTNSGTTYMYYFPSANGTLALTSDIPSTSSFVTLSGAQTISGNKTFTGTNLFKGGTTQFLTSSAGLNDPKTDVGAYGILCQTGGNVGTYYKDGKITNGTNTLTLPLKTGTFAITDDIKIKSAALSGTTLTLTI